MLLHNIKDNHKILKVLSQFVIPFKPTIVHCYVRKNIYSAVLRCGLINATIWHMKIVHNYVYFIIYS